MLAFIDFRIQVKQPSFQPFDVGELAGGVFNELIQTADFLNIDAKSGINGNDYDARTCSATCKAGLALILKGE